MAEHNIEDQVLGVILDGTGYGDDGTIWGGEILLSTHTDFRRVAHLQHLSLPGGDKAAIEPWRMGLSALFHTYGSEYCREQNHPRFLGQIEESHRQSLLSMMENGFNSPLTSSCGRLFDAVAALLNLRLYCDYEGHAAMELEACALRAPNQEWKKNIDAIMAHSESPFFNYQEGKGKIISSEFVRMIIDKNKAGFDVPQLALDFHLELVCAISKLTKQLSDKYNTTTIVLSGGCMQNRLLMEGLFYTLENLGLTVYTGEKIPVNDGGISFGQTIIGGKQYVSRNTNESY